MLAGYLVPVDTFIQQFKFADFEGLTDILIHLTSAVHKHGSKSSISIGIPHAVQGIPISSLEYTWFEGGYNRFSSVANGCAETSDIMSGWIERHRRRAKSFSRSSTRFKWMSLKMMHTPKIAILVGKHW